MTDTHQEIVEKIRAEILSTWEPKAEASNIVVERALDEFEDQLLRIYKIGPVEESLALAICWEQAWLRLYPNGTKEEFERLADLLITFDIGW